VPKHGNDLAMSPRWWHLILYSSSSAESRRQYLLSTYIDAAPADPSNAEGIVDTVGP
jgi:hypothetical protein